MSHSKLSGAVYLKMYDSELSESQSKDVSMMKSIVAHQPRGRSCVMIIVMPSPYQANPLLSALYVSSVTWTIMWILYEKTF